MHNSSESLAVALLGALTVVLPIAFVWAMIARYRLRKKRLAMDFNWYRQTHPECFRGNRVSCYACRGDRINVRNLMNRWFLREHVCNQCGKTLYYSPEST